MRLYVRPPGVEEVLDDVQLGKEMRVMLTETDTVWLLDMAAVSVAGDGGPLALQTIERNARYQEVRPVGRFFLQRLCSRRA